MKIVIITLLFCLNMAKIQLSRDYQAQIKLWKSKVPTQFVYKSKQFEHKQEICGQSQCQFYYFADQNKEIGKEEDRNLTVLLLSGMNGKDILGPKILYEVYGKISAARVIYLPFVNPSGYIQDTQTTYPSNFPIENDFPVSESVNCGKTSAFKLLSHLYQKYQIDLTIYVNDQMPTISYSWSKLYIEDNSKSQDEGIYLDISEMVRYQFGEQMKAGNLYQLNIRNGGNFIDWAYGAKKFQQILSKYCPDEVIKKYSGYTMNGLVFSLGLGKKKFSQLAQTQFDSHIQKSVNVLQKMTKITNPSITVEIKEASIRIKLSGCKGGSIKSFKLLNKKQELVYQKKTEMLIKGDVLYGPPSINNIALPKDVSLSDNLKYQVQFQCDNGWINLGRTIFSKIRQFKQNGTIQVTQNQKNPLEKKKQEAKDNQIDQSQQWSIYKTIGLTVFAIFIVVWIINGIRLTFKIQKKLRIKNFDEKFENIQFAEDSEDFSNHLEREENKSDVVELRQFQYQETTKFT